MLIAHSRLIELLHYDRETGEFRWKVKRRGTKPGRVGFLNEKGYRKLCVEGRIYRAGRLAWFYVTGEWPEFEIDHENRKYDDDRFDNLRPLTHGENLQNTKVHKDNAGGVKGISFDKARGKWAAKICINRCHVWLGRFESKEAAMMARAKAADQLHPYTARG